jgi:hypothetical protein
MGNKKDVGVISASFMETWILQGDKPEQGVGTVRTPFLMYFPSPVLSVPSSTTSQLHGHKEENHKKLWTPVTWDENRYECDHPAPHTKHENHSLCSTFSTLCGTTGSWLSIWQPLIGYYYPHLTEHTLHSGEIMPTKCMQNTSWSSEIWGSHSGVAKNSSQDSAKNVCRV